MMVNAPPRMNVVMLQTIISTDENISTKRTLILFSTRGKIVVEINCVNDSTVSGSAAVIPTDRPNSASPPSRIIMAEYGTHIYSPAQHRKLKNRRDSAICPSENPAPVLSSFISEIFRRLISS